MKEAVTMGPLFNRYFQHPVSLLTSDGGKRDYSSSSEREKTLELPADPPSRKTALGALNRRSFLWTSLVGMTAGRTSF